MAIPYPPMQTLATMIFDGIFDRFPRLKFGVIEQGASGCRAGCARWSRRSKRSRKRGAAATAHAAAERLRAPPDPRDAVSDRAVGWIIEQAGDEVCMFSSDYPHVEGGRNPIKRFEDSMTAIAERARSSASTATISST